MLFNSFEFLLFFPVVTFLYFLLPHRFRWIHLLLASCLFYCFFVPEYLLILLVTIVVDYYAALRIEKSTGKTKKRWLLYSILITCLILGVFKYFNFFNGSFGAIAGFFNLNYPIEALEILLPIGLSFHTFQSLSYVIEVYRGNQKAEKHFGIYSLYVMFYPQLVAGPIERPQNILHQFHEKHHFKFDDVVVGLKMILWGLFKKIVIADRLSLYVDAVYANEDQHNGNSLILATVFFAFQIYCDFSGYSNIAIGTARVMGFKLMTNFNRPYFSRSIAEFWKRWHISLSTWFRDYVYIPLGGNRVPKPRAYFNLMLTFTISGLWHGANWTYVCWGALNGFYLVFAQMVSGHRRSFQRFENFYQILTTFILILFSWIFFRSPSLEVSFSIIHKMMFVRGPLFLGYDTSHFVYGVFFLMMLILVETFEEYKLKDSFSFFKHENVFVRRMAYIAVVFLILLFGVFGDSQFIYFQF
ncbi:MBOAT family O-acyltransferase [Pedobacter immunditicola]|uniref:MBOAT family O-acyltransferase n=1 Tax=Pedobacter immunditicola TaxID=3133440 RepID=UPI0030ABD7AD